MDWHIVLKVVVATIVLVVIMIMVLGKDECDE